jgi:hypothetical protein
MNRTKPWVELTIEEFDTAINRNITITDSRLRDGVYGVALDIAALLKERNEQIDPAVAVLQREILK